jgi:hypothetical protein
MGTTAGALVSHMLTLDIPNFIFLITRQQHFPPFSFWLLLASCFLSKLAGKKKKIGFIVCQVLFPYVAGSQKRVGGKDVGSERGVISRLVSHLLLLLVAEFPFSFQCMLRLPYFLSRNTARGYFRGGFDGEKTPVRVVHVRKERKKNNSLDYPSVIAIKTSQKVRLGERKKKGNENGERKVETKLLSFDNKRMNSTKKNYNNMSGKCNIQYLGACSAHAHVYV